MKINLPRVKIDLALVAGRLWRTTIATLLALAVLGLALDAYIFFIRTQSAFDGEVAGGPDSSIDTVKKELLEGAVRRLEERASVASSSYAGLPSINPFALPSE